MRSSLFAVFIVLTLLVTSVACSAADTRKERPAGVAGQFYPADPAELAAWIDGAISKATPTQKSGRILGVVTPHAGYIYSGAVAANSYAALKGMTYRRVIVIGPSHYEAFSFTSVYDGDAYTTPLGEIPVDKQFAKALAKENSSIRLSSMGHLPTREGTEHSVEVQLPFLQRTLKDFAIVPIVMGDPSYHSARELALALVRLLRDDRETLIVASSDLSHYHDYAQASRMDRSLLDAIAKEDFLSVWINANSRHWEACGVGPVMTLMMASARLGIKGGSVLKYANSGDTAGDKSRVVGYSSVIFVQDPDSVEKESSFSLNPNERSQLLNIARLTVESAVRDHKRYEPAPPLAESLIAERGAFVTITKHGELRGCIGYVTASEPLYLSVRESASAAALEDPRFPPIGPDELEDLKYEVSVMSQFRLVLDPSKVRVGEHGLYLYRNGRTGVLLPQVPVEQHWDRSTFLDNIALKAGLPPQTWRDPATDLFSFTAVVFGEHH